MRRTATLLIVGLLTLAACGGSDSADGTSNDVAVSTAEQFDTDPVDSVPPAATAEGTDDGSAPDTAIDQATTDEPVDPDAPVCVAEGDGENPPADPTIDKPVIDLPAEAPTELVRTVLTEGAGDPAAEGDTVVVDYVGVRSDDGLEFDSSYERTPFPVTLGRQSVIQGWEDGLLGSMTGERIQLDIPSAQAYGPAARSDVICADEDLTFVIDVRSVVKKAAAEDAPTEPGVPFSEGATETTFEDLVVGEGQALADGDTALIRYVNFRGDNGVALETNWSDDPLQIPFGADQLLPGLYQGMTGMSVGGRRAVTIPPDDGFGPEGNPQGGLPAGADMIFVIELLGVY